MKARSLYIERKRDQKKFKPSVDVQYKDGNSTINEVLRPVLFTEFSSLVSANSIITLFYPNGVHGKFQSYDCNTTMKQCIYDMEHCTMWKNILFFKAVGGATSSPLDVTIIGFDGMIL